MEHWSPPMASMSFTGEMARLDGKNPWDPQTYGSPCTIKTMLELRSFCVAFFEQHIRVASRVVDVALLENFTALIMSSKEFYQRAKAVLPELQIQTASQRNAQSNANVQCVWELISLAGHLSGQPGTEDGWMAEEDLWNNYFEGHWDEDGCHEHGKEPGGMGLLSDQGGKEQDAAPRLRLRMLTTRPVGVKLWG